MTPDCFATNPVDKAYSLWGPVRDIDGGNDLFDVDSAYLIIDYKSSVQDVYSSVVRAEVEKTKRLTIFGACTYRGPNI
jgi:hypothetical protein